MTPPLVAMRTISKTFGAVVALRRVSLDVAAGEVIGLVGDNAAQRRKQADPGIHQELRPTDVYSHCARCLFAPADRQCAKAEAGLVEDYPA